MAHKHVLFRSAAREKILQGASALADPVREATLTEVPEKKAERAAALEQMPE